MPSPRLLALAALAIAAPAHADELQSRLLAGAQATPTGAYAFRETLSITTTASKTKTYVNAYDPRRPLPERWRLVSVDGRAPTAKQIADARKAKREEPPGYHGLARWLGSAATRVDGANGAVLYRYPRLPSGTVKLGKHDASANTAAEVVVAGADGASPFVTQVRFTSTKGFRMMLVASVKSMATTVRYRRLDDGMMVPADAASTVSGSMMGKSGELKTGIAYADWRRVR